MSRTDEVAPLGGRRSPWRRRQAGADEEARALAEAEALLLREDTARQQSAPTGERLASIEAQLRAAPAQAIDSALDDEVAAELVEMLMLRETLADACAQLEATIATVRGRLEGMRVAGEGRRAAAGRGREDA